MSRRCLSHDIADLVDGRLGPMATEQAHAHLAACAKCRAAVIAQREASARLRSMRDAAPAPDFMRRLSAIPMAHAPASMPVQNSAAVLVLSDYRGAGSQRPRSAKKAGITVISVAGLVGVAALVGVSGSQVAVSVPATRGTVAPVITTLAQVQSQPVSFTAPAPPAYLALSFTPATTHRSFHLVP
jgi:anti-sigma factor RsiW